MRNLITIALLTIFGTTQAQVGEMFPTLSGQTLDDEVVTIPEQTTGKYTMVGLAWSKKAEEDLQTWLEPVYRTFIAPSGFSIVDYDVNIYFIPMFTGVNKMAHGATVKKLKKENLTELSSHVLFYKGELKPYKKGLSMNSDHQPYFFLLDKMGKIVYSTSGAYTDEKMEVFEGMLGE